MPRGRLTRGGRLGRLATGQAVRGVGTRLSMIGRPEQARRILAQRSALQAAQQAVTVLGGMKGAAMKLGQMLSVLDVGLVPEPHRELFRAKLAELRDRAPEVLFAQMRTVIEDDLGPMARVFADFDEKAVAAASIGQVYRAILRDGRSVAVKVKYPGVDAAVEADMAAAGWHLLDKELAITPELATSAVVLAVDPRQSDFRGLKRRLLPPEPVFSRRADLLTFAALGQLRAANNWHRIAREWMYGEPARTEIGKVIEQWRASLGR